MDRNESMRLLEAVGHLNAVLRARVDRDMAAGGLSIARYRLLRFVEACEPTRASRIADFFGFAHRTVTEAIDGLERDGLVERRRSPTDGRASDIRILPAGIAALRASEGPLRDAAERFFGRLSAKQRDDLRTLLNLVLEAA